MFCARRHLLYPRHVTAVLEMKLLLLAVFLLVCVSTSIGLECTPDICNLVDCRNEIESDCQGVFIKKGGACGCCDACYKAIEPGQACERLDVNNPPQGLCKNGYWCDRNICRPLLG